MSDDAVMEDLANRYQERAALRSAWPEEREDLRRIISEIRVAIAGQYELGEPIGVGGSGIVLRVRGTRLALDRALKFSRPSPGKRELLAAFLSAETDRLVELSHPYLMRVHDRGLVSIEGSLVPYYVMDLYTDVLDADDYVAQKTLLEEDLLELLERIFEAVSYMHAQGVVHLDIKPGNILVRPGNRPVVSDLGFAKILQDGSGVTMIGGTEGFIHPDARKFIVEASSDPNRLRGEAARRSLRVEWDLYALGKTILTLLQIVSRRPLQRLPLYTHRYLKLLACRMLDGKNSMNETLLGLSRLAFDELKYERADDVLLDLRKLTGRYNLDSRIPELNQYASETIQTSTLSTTPFTPRVKYLFQHAEVARLGGFTQLSLLNLVYPTATHTRLEHVIGVFSAMCRYLSALYHDPINPLFRQIMAEDDVLAALLTGLLHDIGHYGLAHDLEEVDVEIFSHERRGKELLEDASTGLAEAIESERLPDGSRGWGVPVGRLLSILNADVSKMRGTVKDRLIHAMIDGPIDADKLDYIIRDSTNLGLTYGSVIDVERLLRVLTVVSKQSGDDTYVNIGIHEKGRVTAEAMAFARYALYGSVYWHHAYRAVKAMLQRIALEYLERVDYRDRTKKEGTRHLVARELYPALRAQSSGAPQSLPLTSLTSGGQVHPGDRAVLEWLASRAGDAGGMLSELIDGRRLFKRVFVVSRWGNESLWHSVTDLMAGRSWRRKLAFQRAFQQRLVVAIERTEVLSVDTSLVLPDARNSFMVASDQGKVLVLVDATQPRPGSGSGLELVQEEDRRRAKIDEFSLSNPEQSSMWNSVRTHLHESLGKVRVFCHPDHARFVSALSRDVVESALDQAARES